MNRTGAALAAAIVGSVMAVAPGCTPIDQGVRSRGAAAAPVAAPTPAPIERLQRSVDDLTTRMDAFVMTNQASQRQSTDDLRASLASLQADIEAQGEEIRHLNENFETLLARFTTLEGQSMRPASLPTPAPTPRVIVLPQRDAPPAAIAEATPVAPEPVAAATAPVSAPAPISTASAEETYRMGLDLYEAGKYRESSATFSDFLARFPKDPLVPNAIYWIGECQYAGGNFEAALISFDQVIKEYPASNKVPAALLKQGMSFRELGNKIQARMILQSLIKRFPASPEAGLAKQRLEGL